MLSVKPVQELADEYGMFLGSMYRIVRGTTYKHVREQLEREGLLKPHTLHARRGPCVQTRVRGEQVSWAKLTETDVRIIKSSPQNTTALAKHYGVSWSTIADVRRGRTWKHVA